MKEKVYSMDREKRGLISLYSLDEDAPKGHPDKPVKKRTITEKDASGVKKAVMDMITDRLSDGSFEIDLGLIKDPKDRCDIVLKLMGFVLPKVSAIDVNGNLELDSVNDELSKLAKQTAARVQPKAGKDISS